jgi:hypothetical protein
VQPARRSIAALMAVKKLEQQLGGIQVGYAGGVIKQINVGTVALASGVGVVTVPWVDANTMIFASRSTQAGTIGVGLAISRIVGTSFTITSQNVGALTTCTTDTSTVAYLAVEV